MAARNNTSKHSRDLAWLNDALDRNPALSGAFNRVVKESKAKPALLKHACLEFLLVYENFLSGRALARADLERQRDRLINLDELADKLIDRTPRNRKRLASDEGFHAFMAPLRAAALAEGRLISDRTLAGLAGYLSHKNTPLNEALVKLIRAGGHCYAAIAELALALLDQIGVAVDEVSSSQVREARRGHGIAVRDASAREVGNSTPKKST
jgi:hypothetical protein